MSRVEGEMLLLFNLIYIYVVLQSIYKSVFQGAVCFLTNLLNKIKTRYNKKRNIIICILLVLLYNYLKKSLGLFMSPSVFE